MQQNAFMESHIMEPKIEEVLQSFREIAHSDSAEIRELLPSVFVVAEPGCGTSSFGKAYAQILDESPLLQIRGTETFLELVFPKDNPQDERLFFSSPQRAVSVRNRFYGTMLVSFAEYSGQELLKSDGFQRMLEFIEQNKNNIHFMFHVLPEFTAKKQLLAKLQEHINMIEVELDKPGLDRASTYVISVLKEAGIQITPACRKRLKERVLEPVIAMGTYSGYRTLNNLVLGIRYEVTCSNMGNRDVLSEELMDRIEARYAAKVLCDKESNRIGFFG